MIIGQAMSTPRESASAVMTVLRDASRGRIDTGCADPAVSGLQIDVDTRDRSVTLTGAVNRDTEKARAVQLASKIENVIRVEDRLTVRPRIP